MMEKGQRGMVRTGTAALGATLMAIALAASPVGAAPFTGKSSGPFYDSLWFDENGQPLHTETQSFTSGYSSLVGTVQCESDLRFSVNKKTARRCAATESEFRAFTDRDWSWAAEYAECRSEDKGGTVVAQVVASESYACVPSKGCRNHYSSSVPSGGSSG